MFDWKNKLKFNFQYCILPNHKNVIFKLNKLNFRPSCVESNASSVTRLGFFVKITATNLLTKLSIIFGNFWGYFEYRHFLIKIFFGYFWGNFLTELGYFLSKHLVTLNWRMRHWKCFNDDIWLSSFNYRAEALD